MNKKLPKMAMPIVLAAGLVLLSTAVSASTGTEFKASADKFDSWLGGEYGRAGALGASMLGVITGMVMKSFMPVLMGLAFAIGIPLVTGIINTSFTAVLPAML